LRVEHEHPRAGRYAFERRGQPRGLVLGEDDDRELR
jgi:hypothetical protein